MSEKKVDVEVDEESYAKLEKLAESKGLTVQAFIDRYLGEEIDSIIKSDKPRPETETITVEVPKNLLKLINKINEKFDPAPGGLNRFINFCILQETDANLGSKFEGWLDSWIAETREIWKAANKDISELTFEWEFNQTKVNQ